MGNKSFKNVWSEGVMNIYKEKYIALCSKLNDCTSKADVQNHNRAMKKLSKLFHAVEKVEDKTFLAELLSFEDKRTQEIAASHCLALNIYVNEAKKVLQVLSKCKTNPIIAFECQSILEVWEKNKYLTF